MMQKVKWIVPALFLLVFLTTPLSAFAASAPNAKTVPHGVTRSVPLLASWASIAGHRIKLYPGQEVNLPYDKGSFHFQLVQQPVSIASKDLSPAIKASSTGCSDASAQISWKDVLGWTVMSYTILQQYCYNGTAITWFPSQNESWSTNWGWNLTSHSAWHTWFSYPVAAYAHGNYAFNYGFPTPWGNVGFASTSGWVEIYIYGNGTYSTDCSC
jgi:hypothetical protein